MQRARIEEDLCAGHQRRKQPDGQTKRMEQRQRRHKAVARGEVGDGADLLDVCQQAFMRMHHPFRVAFRTGGKQHHRGVFRLLRQLGAMRHQQMGEDPQLVLAGDGIFEIFQVDPLHIVQPLRQMPQVAFVQELPRREDGFDLRGSQCSPHPVNTRAVVEHGRNTPAQRSAENRRRRDGGIGQQQPYHFTRLAVALQNTAHAQRLLQQSGVAVGFEIHIFDAALERAITGARRQKRLKQGFTRTHRHARFHHHVMQMLPGQHAPVARPFRLRHRNAGRGQNGQGDAREQATFEHARQTTERRVFSAFDAHRHHIRA